jgi:alpha-1,3-rhamnosyl/mannosyltransferase
MKILVNAMPMTGLLTGIARYLRNLYATMSLMDQVEVSYFNGKTANDLMPLPANSEISRKTASSVRKLPDPVVFGLRAAARLKHEYSLNRICKADASSFDVYHETAFTPARLTAIPTVYSVYDLSLRRYREMHPKDRVWLFECFIKTRLRHAVHILTISEFIRREIMDELNVQPAMVTAVPLAPDPLFVPCSDDLVKEVKYKYHLPESYLLFVGSLEPRKNIDFLIDALTLSDTDIPLVLAGWQGWGKKDWIGKIKSRNLKNRIYVTGHIPDHDLRAVYTGAMALVYPSLYEGFGLPILEAMACNCPVICSNTASMPEVAGDAAILIDPTRRDELAQAIENMVHDTEMRNDFVKKGAQQAAGFTWYDTAEKTRDIFKMAAGEL